MLVVVVVSLLPADGIDEREAEHRRDQTIPEFHLCAYALETVLSFTVNVVKKRRLEKK